MELLTRLPTGSLIVRVGAGGALFYEAKWRHDGDQVKRRVGPAWVVRDRAGKWHRRRGRVPDGWYDEKRATVRMAELVAEHAHEVGRRAREEQAARDRPVTFREVAGGWLPRAGDVPRGASRLPRLPGAGEGRATVDDPQLPLAAGRAGHAVQARRSQVPRPRDEGVRRSARRGDHHRRRVEVPARVRPHRRVSADGEQGPPDAVRNLQLRATRGHVRAAGQSCYGHRQGREPPAAALDFYEPDEIEVLAAAAADGRHRTPTD